MTRHPKPYYPGKPGPEATGLKRTIPLPLMLDNDEWEYLCRMETAVGKKKARFIRERTFKSGWRADLLQLREIQGANIP